MELKRMLKGTMVICFLVSLFGIANATPINITVADGNSDPSFWRYDGWYTDVKSGFQIEDNEVERGCVYTQYWDLEGFFLEGTELSVVGGFNFKDGYDYYGNDNPFMAGDIFINTEGDCDVYEYVIVMNYAGNGYDVREIDAFTQVGLVSEDINTPESNPFNWLSGGSLVSGAGGTLSFNTIEGDYLECQGYKGNETHYEVSNIDLSFLEEEGVTDFSLHYTIDCGNDMIKGDGSISIPEPGTFSLLFMGSLCMIGFWALRRKRKNNR